MKYCSANIKNHCLLAGLVALLVTGYASAADKKLSPSQQLRATKPSHTVRVPVKVKTPLVVPANKSQASIKPAKKLVGTVAAPSVVVKKKKSPGIVLKPTGIPAGAPIRVPVRVPVKLSHQPVKPVITAPRATPRVVQPRPGFSNKTHAPVQALSVLPAPPVRRVQPVAPVVLNPRNGGFASTSPAVKPVTPLAKQKHRSAGSSSAPGHSFSLAPPGHPATGAGSPSQRGGFAPMVKTDQQTNSATGRLNRMTGEQKSPTPGGGFVPDQVYGGASTPGERASGRTSTNRAKPSGNALHNNSPASNALTFRPVITGPSSVRNSGGKDDPGFGDFINDFVNDWAEDDMAIGGGKVPDPDYAPIVTSPSPATPPSSQHGFGSGDVTRVESDGTKVTSHQDGSTDTFDAEGGHLETPSGIKTSPAVNGGTDVEVLQTGVTAHFGAEKVRDDAGEIKESGLGYSELPDGGIITDESNGSISVGNVDGSTDTWQRDGSHLQTGPGIKAVATPDGGTDAIGPDGKYTVHFGGGETTTERGKAKYIGGGTVQNPDGSKEQGKKPESNYSSGSDDSDNSSEDSDKGSDDNADSNDDSADSGDDSNSDDDNGDDKGGSDEALNGFDSGGGSDGGPEAAAKTTVDDRVARMKGEKSDPESPEDSEPGNGGSAPGSVSQPGPDGGHRASPLARPSAEGHQPLVNVVVPTVKSRSSVGGGDCFRESGCDNAPTGDFRLDPFNRDPVTNPGGH